MVKIRAYFSQLGIFVSIFMLSTLNILSILLIELFLPIKYSRIGILLNSIVLASTILLVVTCVIGTRLAGSKFRVRYPWAPSSVHQVDVRISLSMLPLIRFVYDDWAAAITNNVFKQRWILRYFVRESARAVELSLSRGYRSVTISSHLLNNNYVLNRLIKKIQIMFPDVVTEIEHSNLTKLKRFIYSLVTKKTLSETSTLETTLRVFIFID